MQRDADDRRGLDAPDADAGLLPDVEEAALPGDANPDDVLEQRLEVPFEDDDYPPG